MINNFFSTQTLGHILASTASGAAVSYKTNYPIKNALILSGATGLASSLTTSVLDRETNVLFKLIVMAATVFAAYKAAQYGDKFLKAKLGITLDPKTTTFLMAANIAGQAVSFLIASSSSPVKPFASAIDKMNEDELKALHTLLITDGNQDLNTYSRVDQQRIKQRFQGANLDVTKLKIEPLTADEIKSLTQSEILYIFPLKVKDAGEGKAETTWTTFVPSANERAALVLRFIEFRQMDETVTKADLEKAYANASFPKTVEDAKKLSPTDKAFFVGLFKDKLNEAWNDLSIDIQWAFVSNKPEELEPTFTEDNVKDAPKAAIEWLVKKEWDTFSPEMQTALTKRCQELTIELKDKVSHPTTPGEVGKLDQARLQHYYDSFKKDAKNADIFDEELVAAFLGRFMDLKFSAKELPETLFSTPECVTAIKLPQSGQEASAITGETLPWVHRVYTALPETWLALRGKDRESILTQKFNSAKLEVPYMPTGNWFGNPLPEMLDIKKYHAAITRAQASDRNFTNTTFWRNQRTELNSRFADANLSQIA